MKSVLKLLTLTTLLVALVVPTFAQKNKKKKGIDQAHVKYTMTAEGGMVASLTGSTIDLFFTPTHAKVLGDIMSGMIKMDMRFDNKDKKGMMLMDMMGQKKFVEMDDKMVDESKNTNQKPPSVEYLKKYKKIAGYKCQQAKMMVEGLAEPVIIYITEKIQPQNLGDVSMMKFTGLKGFPLSWEIEEQGMKFKIEATEISLNKLPKKIFNLVIPEGYEKMTMEDLQKMGGSLGM